MKTTRELQPRVRACANDHHNLLLDNLLSICKVLSISVYKKQKQSKETNWKQKSQKNHNENICLTSLNTEMNGNFHFLSFCCALLRVQKCTKMSLIVVSTIWFKKNGFSRKNGHEKWDFQVAFYSIFTQIQLCV